MDPGWTLIDVQSLATVQWVYLLEVADAGMTPAYQAHLIAHLFPRFTDPAGMSRQAQRQVLPPQGEQPQAQPQAPAQTLTQVRHRVQQVQIPPRQMGSDPGAGGSSSRQGRRRRQQTEEQAPQQGVPQQEAPQQTPQ